MSKFDWDILLLCVIIFWHEENVAYIYFYFYLVFSISCIVPVFGFCYFLLFMFLV